MVKRIFFYLLIVLSLSGAFYLPDRLNDRFFTSGMLWMGLVIGVLGVMFSIIIGRRMRFSGLVLGVTGGLAVIAVYTIFTGDFSLQQFFWGVTLCLFMMILDNSSDRIRIRDIFFLLALLGFVEAIIGIGQYVRWYERYHSSFPVTGTFENPAGLAACLAVCFPAALYFVFSPFKAWKIWGWTVACTQVGVVILSGTRTGIIALALVTLVALKNRICAGCKISGWMKVGGGIVGVSILVGLYLLKKHSADGRLLVWACSGEMLRDAPVIGHGPGSFQAKYMDYQADWLTRHSSGQWGWLADNVKHPFNEYLKIGVEYGSLGLLAVVALILGLWRLYRRGSPEEFPLYWSLLALGVCGMFSYPFNYPVVCVLLFLILGVLGRTQDGVFVCGWAGRIGLGVIAVLLLVFTVNWKNMEVEWYRISRLALSGKTEKILPDYVRLYPFMRENPLFLYNYGAELHEIGRWRESAGIMEECSRGINDTDVQMLLADNYLQLGEFNKAEHHYLLAAQMCPNRFLPLYHLVKLYEKTGRREESLTLARQIVTKPVKVSSYMIEKIRKEMQEYVDKNN